MEEGLRKLKDTFQLKDTDIRTYSGLTLAYIGDAIYELVIRTILVEKGNMQVNKLNNRASRLVKASAQSAMIEKLTPFLTEAEVAVYKKGRNGKPNTKAKNASMADYKRATGFEALMGYLYLTEQWDRMLELIRICLEEGDTDGREIPGKQN